MTSVEHFEDSAEREAREGEVVEDLERNPIQNKPPRDHDHRMSSKNSVTTVV
jgi:hypothetical protein